jgi:hypothetical protein
MSVRRANKSRRAAPNEAPEAKTAPKTPATRASKTSNPAPSAPESSAPESSAPAVVSAAREAPRSAAEAEERYVIARDAWIVAMRNARSGRSADLASLGITQEAYELATAEVERWRSGVMVAFKIEPAPAHQAVEKAVDQELAWRRVHDQSQRSPGRLLRLLRRITGGD